MDNRINNAMNFLGVRGECGEKLQDLFRKVGYYLLIFVLMLLLCNGSRYLLKHLQQPRITFDIIVGLCLGNLSFLRRLIDMSTTTLRFIIDFGMICYMFALGIEMDPNVLFRGPSRDTKVAYAGIVFTFILAGMLTPFLNYTNQNRFEFTLTLSTALSGTASPVLTRLLTSLKIGKSDIGRLVIAVGMQTDFICTLLLSIGYVFMPLPTLKQGEEHHRHRLRNGLKMAFALLIQTIFTAKFSPVFLNWVNNENPPGKPMKGSHLVLAIAYMALICALSPAFGYSPILSAFMAGICMPREGRVSKWLISKINYLLSTIFFPIFFFWMGFEAYLFKLHLGQLGTWTRFFVLLLVGVVGKVAGTTISGIMLGINWPESVSIGLLLITKGHYHIYLAIASQQCGATVSTSIGMVVAIFCTVLHGPSVVARIIQRAREKVPTHRMTLQLLDPLSELRIMLCVHGTKNVPSAINLMEISRGTAHPGILVYLTDMIELTDQIAATLQRAEELENTTVNDRAVIEMRNQITSSTQAYVKESGDGITLRRTLAVSPLTDMSHEICNLAEDLMIALIILPFHKSQRADGTLEAGHSGFRYVNRKVLRNAPCSVGILVDRGLGSLEKISRSQISVNIAVIFIGGKDDREGLAYAGYVARHPGVKLTVIRFLVDASSDHSTRLGYRQNTPEQEEETHLDDECFARFYERHVAGGRVSYTEKHLANSAETYSTLRSFEGQYSLIIVGRGGRVNSVLTMGMNDWQQCPELGPIGDVLSGSAFSIQTSVLIIQQHNLKGELDGLDEDFSIM